MPRPARLPHARSRSTRRGRFDKNQPRALDLASRARVLAGDVVARATIDAVQIYGGYGFVNDFPVEKLMRDARAFEALHGDERFGRVLAQKAMVLTWISFHDSPLFQGVRPDARGFAKSMMRRSRSSTTKKSRCHGI
jgi:hypothetical protein